MEEVINIESLRFITPSYKEHRIPVIYLIFCKISKRIYIGRTRNLWRRYGDYKRSHRRKQSNGRRVITAAICKYGFEQFSFCILETVADDAATMIQREEFWIRRYDSVKNGYNCTYSGRGPLGVKRSPESRAKTSQRFKGKKLSREHVEAISRGHMGPLNSFYGKSHTEETKRHLSLVHSGKKLSSEHKEKLRQRMLDCNPMLGKHHDIQQSSAMYRAVLMYTDTDELIWEFESLTQASRTLNIPLSTISGCCNGRLKTCRGYVFRLKNPDVKQGRMPKLPQNVSSN